MNIARLIGTPRRLLVVATSIVATLSGGSFVGLTASSGAATHSGTVEVLSAGSLSNIVVLLGAAFTKDTGYKLQNTSEGSSAIASGIVAKTLQGDVFLSASTSADVALEGAAHGNWINGYTTFGTSPDVLAYYPHSRFAAALTTSPWYQVITSRGFELGRTNPAVDPGGVLDVDAIDGLGYAYNIPSLLKLATNTHNVYNEQAIPGLLTAGQLDAAFMYAVSARAAGLPYVALTGTRNLNAHYTVALLNRAPDPGPAAAFVKWLLTRSARTILAKQGLVPSSSAHVLVTPGH